MRSSSVERFAYAQCMYEFTITTVREARDEGAEEIEPGIGPPWSLHCGQLTSMSKDGWELVETDVSTRDLGPLPTPSPMKRSRTEYVVHAVWRRPLAS